MFKHTKILIFSLVLISFSACKKQIFLKRKYFNGSYFSTINKSNSSAIYSNIESKHQVAQLMNDKNNPIHETIINNPLKDKNTSTINHSVNKLVKSIKNTTSHLTTIKVLNYLTPKKELTNKLKRNISKVKNSKKKDNSNWLFYIKALLLFLLFWTLLIILYSNKLSIQVTSYILILKVLGYIALAAIIWAIIYLIFNQFKKAN